MPTQVGIVNTALEMIGSQEQITGLNDGSPTGNAAGVLYTPTLQLLLRAMDPDFARQIGALATTIGMPLAPWAYEYLYPSNCLRARQVAPPGSGPGALADINDPQPVRGLVAFDPNVGGNKVPQKVILSNQQNAVLVFTTSDVTEAMFDPGFVEAFARRLANPLALALAGRPDFARELLEESERYAGLAALSEELS